MSLKTNLSERIFTVVRQLGPSGIADLLRPYVPQIDELAGRSKGKIRCCRPEHHHDCYNQPTMQVDLESGFLGCRCGFSRGAILMVAEIRGLPIEKLVRQLELQLAKGKLPQAQLSRTKSANKPNLMAKIERRYA